ncbi:uncharacterized protein LOC110035712 isoform X2 [Phalaenopsis equestris]|uniref:uncharacterized protein LOC110035712 isoform X2 n=1 Tax=Phalaenopsis equestris TaxID=78828 RepID=UPI0009E4E14B|nr:uncharacterized protein LOC110035712 isoform X2 [Phalaenopsis equestris]
MAYKSIGPAIACDKGRYKEQSKLLCSYSKLIRGGCYHKTQKNLLKIFREGSFFRLVHSCSPYFGRHCNEKLYTCCHNRGRVGSCHLTKTPSSETKICSRKDCCSDVASCQMEDEKDEGYGSQLCEQVLSGRVYHPNQGLAAACKFVYNDAKFVNERARNDIILLSRGLTRLNDRARQDVAVIGLGFLKLDARAREDTEKIDYHMRKKAAYLRNVATILKDKAQSKLKNAADKHWSDGALEADLKRADSVARRRAMEDAFMALKFVRNIHDMMANKLYQQPQKEGSFSINDLMGFITLEKNGKTLDLFGGEISTDRITAIQDAYWSMASALSEADGIDYTDPEELELVIATLIDLDAMDSKSSVSLLAECSSSPDVSTRKALANALASAPSMWILGNAGMGALQRLAEDHNPAVATAASKAINELKQQWELEEGDSLRFIMNQHFQEDNTNDVSEEDK